MPTNTPVLDQLVAAIAPVAKKLNIPMLVIIGRDPTTGEVRLYGSEAAIGATKSVVEDKYGFGIPDTAWNDTVV
jgi:hypothetical protein